MRLIWRGLVWIGRAVKQLFVGQSANEAPRRQPSLDENVDVSPPIQVARAGPFKKAYKAIKEVVWIVTLPEKLSKIYHYLKSASKWSLAHLKALFSKVGVWASSIWPTAASWFSSLWHAVSALTMKPLFSLSAGVGTSAAVATCSILFAALIAGYAWADIRSHATQGNGTTSSVVMLPLAA